MLLKEVLDNCVDEFRMGMGKQINVKVNDRYVEVRDFGRGIPLGKMIDAVSIMNTGGKYDSKAFKKSVGLNGVGISGGRLMNNGVVPPEKSTAYLAIYYAVMGVTGGLAPLLAGWLLSRNLGAGYAIGWIRLDVYTLFFVISLLVFGAAWWGFGKVRPDDRYTTRGVWRALLKGRG